MEWKIIESNDQTYITIPRRARPVIFSQCTLTINLTTGAASPLGQVGNNLVINDIAVSFVAVPEPSSFTLLSICAMLIVGASRNRSTSRQA
jgi:hypothetical protein